MNGSSPVADVEQFLHTRRLPHIWCPGCGVGMVTGAFLRVMTDLGMTREKTVVVGGIGCSSRAVGYLDLNTVHTLHGRALAFATGIKIGRNSSNAASRKNTGGSICAHGWPANIRPAVMRTSEPWG